ncbi:MAG: SirB1 family protein [Nitrospiria bacterium]
MTDISENEIKALISLLSEKDPQNLKTIKNKLFQLYQPALPYLKQAMNDKDIRIRSEVTSILEEFRVNDLTKRWIAFTSGSGEINLEQGALLFSLYCYPDLNMEEYRMTLDRWASQISEHLNRNHSAESSIQIVQQYFFKNLGFTGNQDDYNNPHNSYLPAVMDSKRGLPITLSVVFLLITRRLHLPYYPIGMPGHFIVKYQDAKMSFFLDPFNGGRILNEQDCVQFLLQSGYGYRKEYLEKTGDRTILQRMILNLIPVYTSKNNDRAASFMTKLIDILNHH